MLRLGSDGTGSLPAPSGLTSGAQPVGEVAPRARASATRPRARRGRRRRSGRALGSERGQRRDQQADQRDGEQRAGHEHVRVRGRARDDQLRRQRRGVAAGVGVGDGVPSGIASSPGWRRQRRRRRSSPPEPPDAAAARAEVRQRARVGRVGRRRGGAEPARAPAWPAPASPSRSAWASASLSRPELLLLLLALAGVVALDRRRQRVAEVRVLLLVGVLDRAPRPLERLLACGRSRRSARRARSRGRCCRTVLALRSRSSRFARACSSGVGVGVGRRRGRRRRGRRRASASGRVLGRGRGARGPPARGPPQPLSGGRACPPHSRSDEAPSSRQRASHQRCSAMPGLEHGPAPARPAPPRRARPPRAPPRSPRPARAWWRACASANPAGSAPKKIFSIPGKRNSPKRVSGSASHASSAARPRVGQRERPPPPAAALHVLVEVARRRQPRRLGVEARVRHGEEVLHRLREHALEPVRRAAARASRASRARRRRSTSAGSRPCARPSRRRTVHHVPYRTNYEVDMPDFDAVVVGASLAGCATAIHLGRAGHRVALVEQAGPTRPPTSACAGTSSSPAPSPRSSGSACWRSSRPPAPCAGTRACGRRYGWFAEPPGDERRAR